MSDAMKAVSNPDLVCAIERAREDVTPEAWAKMVREAEKARFITPVDLSPRTEEASFSLHMLQEAESGRSFYIAFTDWGELRKWRGEAGQKVLVLTFDDYARLVLDGRLDSGGFIVNPFGGNVVFDRAMIEAVRQGRLGWNPEKVVMEKGTTVCLGEPEVYPSALADAISGYLGTQPGVAAAYLRQMERDGQASYLVAVDFQGDPSALFSGISGAARDFLGDMPLNLTQCDSALWRDTAEGLKPFYRRER